MGDDQKRKVEGLEYKKKNLLNLRRQNHRYKLSNNLETQKTCKNKKYYLLIVIIGFRVH